MALLIVVDDDPGEIQSLSTVLTKAGHRVRSASNGIEALALIGLLNPDLVIADISMPEMGGVELILTMRDRWPDLPVFMISGHSVILDDTELLGAAARFRKPIDFGALLDAVRRITSSERGPTPTGGGGEASSPGT